MYWITIWWCHDLNKTAAHLPILQKTYFFLKSQWLFLSIQLVQVKLNYNYYGICVLWIDHSWCPAAMLVSRPSPPLKYINHTSHFNHFNTICVRAFDKGQTWTFLYLCAMNIDLGECSWRHRLDEPQIRYSNEIFNHSLWII